MSSNQGVEDLIESVSGEAVSALVQDLCSQALSLSLSLSLAVAQGGTSSCMGHRRAGQDQVCCDLNHPSRTL